MIMTFTSMPRLDAEENFHLLYHRMNDGQQTGGHSPGRVCHYVLISTVRAQRCIRS
jgi:hypothetical protein